MSGQSKFTPLVPFEYWDVAPRVRVCPASPDFTRPFSGTFLSALVIVAAFCGACSLRVTKDAKG